MTEKNNLIDARVRNFPFHRTKVTRTTNSVKKTTQTFLQGDEVKVSLIEFEKNEHLLETEEQYQARNNPKVKAKI